MFRRLLKRFKCLWKGISITPYNAHKYLEWKCKEEGLSPSERLAYFLTVDHDTNQLRSSFSGGLDLEILHFLVVEVDGYSYFCLGGNYYKLSTEILRKYCTLNSLDWLPGIYYASGVQDFLSLKDRMERLKVKYINRYEEK